MRKITLLFMMLIVAVGEVMATPTETVLGIGGGWSYAHTGRANISFNGWGHFNIANVGDIDVANYKSITMTYSALSGRFKIATIGLVGTDVNHSMETSDEINSATATSGSVTINFNTSNYTNNKYNENNSTIISCVDLINQGEDVASITIESVILTDNSDNTYMMSYGDRWGTTPSYLENKYTFQSWGQVGHEQWKTTYNTNEIHRFTITFGSAVPAGFKFRIYTPDGDDEGDADDESLVDIAEGETTATVDIDYTYNYIDLVNTNNKYTTVDIASVKRTVLTRTTTELWTGTNAFSSEANGWTNFEGLRTDNKGNLGSVKFGDIIRLTVTNATEGNFVNICNGSTYASFAGASTTVTAQDDAQFYSFTLTDAETIERITETGIVISGRKFTLTKVELITNDGNTTLDYAPITITEAGVATYSGIHKLNFTGLNLKAYYASDINSTTHQVVMTRINKVPANTGLYLVGATGNYQVPYYDGDDTESVSSNKLVATGLWNANLKASNDNEDGKYRYILAKNSSDVIAFYKLTSEKNGFSNHRAYLETDTDITPTSGARVALIFSDEETTGIRNIQEQQRSNGIYYDLHGMRIQQPTKGLYIVNGKKVIVK